MTTALHHNISRAEVILANLLKGEKKEKKTVGGKGGASLKGMNYQKSSQQDDGSPGCDDSPNPTPHPQTYT